MAQQRKKRDPATAEGDETPVASVVETEATEVTPIAVEVMPVEETAPAQVRVVNISLDTPEYVPLANGALHRLDPKGAIDVALADVTEATRQVESTGRIVINPL